MFLRSLMLVTLFIPMMVLAETWVDVGADTEAKYYVDTDSIVVEGENTIVTKKGIYTNVLTDKLEGDNAVVFKGDASASRVRLRARTQSRYPN
jgi:hypothetical protein